MTVVVDANVWISALLNTRGFCATLLKKCLKQCMIVVSSELATEVRRVFLEKLKVLPSELEMMLAPMLDGPLVLTPVRIEPGTCRDPNDLHVLGLAVAADADFIVTGDLDLLVLKSFRDIPIVNPAEFLVKLQQSRDAAEGD